MIRSAQPEDTAELISITDGTLMFRPNEIETLDEVLKDYYREEIFNDHHCVVADEDGKRLGFAYYAPAEMTDRAWQLWWIVVRRDMQSRGIGTSLLRHVEDAVRRAMGRVLFIETGSMPHYDPTRRFYLKNGYEQCAELRDFYADGDSMIVFRKDMRAR
jgi:GNAT superfamily N-acetyltransferase